MYSLVVQWLRLSIVRAQFSPWLGAEAGPVRRWIGSYLEMWFDN